MVSADGFLRLGVAGTFWLLPSVRAARFFISLISFWYKNALLDGIGEA